MDEMYAFRQQATDLKHRGDETNIKAQRASEKADEASKKISAILGDSNSMQSFVASTSKEV
jgi:hypothetical protein